MVDMSREEFEEAVSDALDQVPPELLALFDQGELSKYMTDEELS